MIFDFRPPEGESKAGAERLNTFTLVHETAHLLCFNTGLLAIDHEPPRCVSEGLATYFEMWRPWRARGWARSTGRDCSRSARPVRVPVPWIETRRLFAEDDLFYDEATAQLAYGQCWILLNYLLQSRTWNPRLVAYLEAVAAAPGSGGRGSDQDGGASTWARWIRWTSG